MWVAIFGIRIIASFFYHCSLTSERYRNLLENIRRVTSSITLGQLVSTQDGAAAHNSKDVEYI